MATVHRSGARARRRLAFALVAGAALSALPVGCASKGASGPKPPISRGEALYRDRCDRCHDLVPPNAYASDQWAGVLSRMQPYAGLTDDEVRAIQEWIESEE